MTSTALTYQYVAIRHLLQTLINVLVAFAYITSRQLFKEYTITNSFFKEICAQILGDRIQQARPWHHVCKFYVVYQLQSHVLTLSKNLEEAERQNVNGNNANCSFFSVIKNSKARLSRYLDMSVCPRIKKNPKITCCKNGQG